VISAIMKGPEIYLSSKLSSRLIIKLTYEIWYKVRRCACGDDYKETVMSSCFCVEILGRQEISGAI
jgi:hypothetical protein